MSRIISFYGFINIVSNFKFSFEKLKGNELWRLIYAGPTDRGFKPSASPSVYFQGEGEDTRVRACHFWIILGHSWITFCHFWVTEGHFSVILYHFGSLLDHFLTFRLFWVILGHVLYHFVSLLGHCGSFFSNFVSHLDHLGSLLGHFWITEWLRNDPQWPKGDRKWSKGDVKWHKMTQKWLKMS